MFMKLVTILTLSLTIGPGIPGFAAWMANTRTISEDPENQSSPAVGYDQVHDEFLVVWTAGPWGSHRIRGIRVDSEGLPVGSSFLISDTDNNQYEVDLAFDPAFGRFLVVWTEDYSSSDSDIRARFVASTGPSSTEPSFLVTASTIDEDEPSVAVNPTDGEFLVVWEEIPADSGSSAVIVGRRLPVDGSVPSSILSIASGQDNYYHPVLDWNRLNGQFLVVFNRVDAAHNWNVYGLRLSSSGVPIGQDIPISSGNGDQGQGVASCRGIYLVVWTTSFDQSVFARRLSAEGFIDPVTVNLTGATDHNYWPVHLAADDNAAEFLVTWRHYFTQDPTISDGIMSALVGVDSTLHERFIEYRTIDEFNYIEPDLVFGGNSKALVVWSSERPPAGDSYDIRGRLTGGRIFADDFEAGDTVYWNP